jgi:hypothetical protein
LKPVAMPNEPYGAGTDAIQAQKAIPIANALGQQSAQPVAPPPSVQQSPVPQAPVTVTPLDAPTQRPNEHVMTGAPIGPGL